LVTTPRKDEKRGVPVSDKLQFVVRWRKELAAGVSDKLKFVGH
jgi:hypothetical protein